GDYIKATEDLMAAFAEPGVLDRSFALPLLSEQEFPGEQAVMMHLVDTVVHAWDLARTLDLPVEFDRPVTDPVLALSRQIPDDETARDPRHSSAQWCRSPRTPRTWTRSSPCSAAPPAGRTEPAPILLLGPVRRRAG